jgi:hypothetical protein
MEFINKVALRRLLLKKRAEVKSQAALARTIGVSPQNLSLMLHGSTIHGKVLRWLGYEPVRGLYQPVKPTRTKRGN